ncbi:MAG: hypothetical protein Q9171_005806 [Xanthocarpia ochracea]
MTQSASFVVEDYGYIKLSLLGNGEVKLGLECRHPETKQRLVDTFSISADISLEKAEGEEHGLRIICTKSVLLESPGLTSKGRTMDTKASTAGTGFELRAEASTSLMSGFWRFTSDLSTKDSAYTQLALAAHNDNTYFTDPAGLQTFHLLSHTNGGGGTSLLVDGFRAADILREESPEAFQTLCETKIRGHTSGNEGIAIMSEHAFPVITLEDDKYWRTSRVTQIRWNNDDRAAMTGLSWQEIAVFYAAARKWVEVLRRPDSEYWVQVEPRLLEYKSQ